MYIAGPSFTSRISETQPPPNGDRNLILIEDYETDSQHYDKELISPREQREQSGAPANQSTFGAARVGMISNIVLAIRGVLTKALDPVSSKHRCIAAILFGLTAAGVPSAAQSADDLAALDSGIAYASLGSVEVGVNAPTISPKASDLFSRTDNEYKAYSNCDREGGACPPQVRSWRASIEGLNGLAGLKLLTAVNAAVNQLITYRDDLTAYGTTDHWATPLESLTGYGDCEDYAILKYLSLIELGMSSDQMRIVILKDNARDIGHAVLTVTLNGGTYVLDNVIAQPTLDSALAHYQPIYSFNGSQQWLNVSVRPSTDNVAASDPDRRPVTVILPAAHVVPDNTRFEADAQAE